MQPNVDSFEEIMQANLDLTQALAATYMFRRFLSLGVKCEYVERNGEFSHIKLEMTRLTGRSCLRRLAHLPGVFLLVRSLQRTRAPVTRSTV